MYCGRMTKKEKLITDMANIVLNRYETIGKRLTPDDWNNIWMSLLGVYDRDGYDKAKEYAVTAKLQ